MLYSQTYCPVLFNLLCSESELKCLQHRGALDCVWKMHITRIVCSCIFVPMRLKFFAGNIYCLNKVFNENDTAITYVLYLNSKKNHIILIYALSAAGHLTGMTGYTDRLRQTHWPTPCQVLVKTYNVHWRVTCLTVTLHVCSKILLIPYTY